MLASAPTLVHTKETTVGLQSGCSYQDYRIAQDPEAWSRVSILYALLDLRDGRDNTTTLQSCRTRAWFARNIYDGAVTVLSNACHLRWCPLCQRSTRIRVQYATKTWIKNLDRPKFLTLTIKHTETPLREQLSFLYRSFSKLRSQPFFKKACRGGVYFFQVKLDRKGEYWHPHLHVILDSNYIPRKKLSAAWLAVTNTSKVIDIRAVTDPDKTADYIARYTASPADVKELPEQKALDLMTDLRGRRLCGTWGTAQRLHLQKPVPPIKADWQNVGGWWTVTSFMKYDESSEQIFKAWLEHHALPEGVTVFDNIPECEVAPTIAEPDPSLAWKQYPLPFR